MHLGNKPKLWLANEIGISSGSLSTAISEEGNATLKTVDAVSAALKVHPAVLMGGSSDSNYNIPQDILEILEGQNHNVYEAIRAILKTIATEKSDKKQQS